MNITPGFMLGVFLFLTIIISPLHFIKKAYLSRGLSEWVGNRSMEQRILISYPIFILPSPIKKAIVMTEVFVEQFIFQLTQKKGQYIVNGQEVSLEINRINNRLFHVIHDGKSYNVFIHKLDKDSNEVSLSINEKRTQVKVQSRIEKLLKELGMEHSLSKKLDSLKAPMPGLIHSLKVEAGQEVKKGDPLLILEAMKMENIIKSPGEGVVKEIHVVEKNSVEKNALLITFA